MDGWGIGPDDASNPIYGAGLQIIPSIEANFPAGALQASGTSIGLPWNEEGNSEVGHLTIGAGRILFQHFQRIEGAIRDGSFFTLPRLKAAFDHAKQSGGAVHLVGLLTGATVHASMDHIVALLEMAKREGTQAVYLHLFTDGRDSDPHSAAMLTARIEKLLDEKGVGTIADLVGRYYAMDRDRNWDRTARAYRLLVAGEGNHRSLAEALRATYDRGYNDEYVEPTIPGEPHPIQANDAVVFFNFREDRMRQISSAFLDPAFKSFPLSPIPNLFLATFTEYNRELPGFEIFSRETIPNPLGQVLADKGRVQLRVAETEKYAHVTYFFNGLREEPFPNEYRILVPSRVEASHADHPEMMATPITDRALASLQEGGVDFILLNYANADMIAHTGNFEATVRAVQTVDRELGRLMRVVLDGGHVLLVTSDHGNAECLIDRQTGEPQTKHDPSPVPFYLIGKEFARPVPRARRLETIGLLADVAPTILELLGLPKPPEMTGESLLPQLH